MNASSRDARGPLGATSGARDDSRRASSPVDFRSCAGRFRKPRARFGHSVRASDATHPPPPPPDPRRSAPPFGRAQAEPRRAAQRRRTGTSAAATRSAPRGRRATPLSCAERNAVPPRFRAAAARRRRRRHSARAAVTSRRAKWRRRLGSRVPEAARTAAEARPRFRGWRVNERIRGRARAACARRGAARASRFARRAPQLRCARGGAPQVQASGGASRLGRIWSSKTADGGPRPHRRRRRRARRSRRKRFRRRERRVGVSTSVRVGFARRERGGAS